MSAKTVWERAKVEGKDVLEYVKKAVAEGNARRIVIRQKGNKLVEFPLTVGVVGAVFAPMLAAIGAIAARTDLTPSSGTPSRSGRSTTSATAPRATAAAACS